MRYIFHFGKYILTRIVWVGKKSVLNRVNSNYDISRTTEPIYMKLCIPVADTQKYLEKKIGAASSTGTGATSHRVFIMIPLIRANERAYWNANISKTTQFIGTKLLRHKAVTQGYVQKKNRAACSTVRGAPSHRVFSMIYQSSQIRANELNCPF